MSPTVGYEVMLLKQDEEQTAAAIASCREQLGKLKGVLNKKAQTPGHGWHLKLVNWKASEKVDIWWVNKDGPLDSVTRGVKVTQEYQVL